MIILYIVVKLQSKRFFFGYRRLANGFCKIDCYFLQILQGLPIGYVLDGFNEAG